MRSLLSPAHSRLRRLVAAAVATGIVLLGSAGVAQAASGPAFTAHANPASNQFGSMVPEVLSASGLPTDATGIVNFTDLYDDFLCSSPVTNGATDGCNYYLGYQAGSTYTITAAYSGDSTYGASSATTTYTVTPAPSTFTAAASPASQVYGNPVTLSESGFPSYASGSINFQDAATGAVLCTIADIQATQSCQTDGTQQAGTESVTALYSGDNDFQPSTATTGYTITKARISPTFTVTPDPSTYGQTLTFTESGFPAAATGTITYTDQTSTPLCTITLPAASCDTNGTQPAAQYSVTAQYSGDDNYQGSTANTQFEVTRATFTTSVTVTPNPTAYATPVTFDSTGVPADATGTIDYTAGGTFLCTATLPTASCATDGTQAPGAYAVVATYNGDDNYTASSSGASGYTVNKAAAPFTAAAATDPADHASPVDLIDSGLPSGDGSGPAASGTITYTDTTTGLVLCTTTLPATTCPTDGTQPSGTQDVTAAYSGDAFYATATAAFSYTVKLPTTMKIAVTPSRIAPKQAIVLQAADLPADATGTVTFGYSLVGGQYGDVFCTAPRATLTCSATAPTQAGTYTVTGIYSGDAKYSSVSMTTTLTVAAAGTAAAPVTGANPAAGGDAAPTSGAPGAASAFLAYTGVNLGPGIAGLILLTSGAVLLWAARRDTRRTI